MTRIVRPRRGELGIILRILGMAVMGEMEIAEIARRQYEQEPGHIGADGIEPLAAEGRPVDAFMLEGEEEDEHDAMGQHGEEQDQRVGCQHHCRAGRGEERQVTAEMRKPRPVGQALEMRQHFGRHRCNDVAMRDMVDDRHGPNQATKQPCVKIGHWLLNSQR